MTKEERKAYMAKYYVENKEHIRELMKKYQEENLDEQREYRRKYYQNYRLKKKTETMKKRILSKKEYVEKILAVNLSICQSYLDGNQSDVQKLHKIMVELIQEALTTE